MTQDDSRMNQDYSRMNQDDSRMTPQATPKQPQTPLFRSYQELASQSLFYFHARIFIFTEEYIHMVNAEYQHSDRLERN